MYELKSISASFFPLQALQEYYFSFFVILCAKVGYYYATYLRNLKNLSKKSKKSRTTQIGCGEIIIFAARRSKNRIICQ